MGGLPCGSPPGCRVAARPYYINFYVKYGRVAVWQPARII